MVGFFVAVIAVGFLVGALVEVDLTGLLVGFFVGFFVGFLIGAFVGGRKFVGTAVAGLGLLPVMVTVDAKEKVPVSEDFQTRKSSIVRAHSDHTYFLRN